MNWLLCGAFDPGYAAFLDRGQPEGCSGSALFSVQLLCTSEERQKIAVASSIHGDACSGFWSLDRIHPSAQTFEAGIQIRINLVGLKQFFCLFQLLRPLQVPGPETFDQLGIDLPTAGFHRHQLHPGHGIERDR